MRSAIPFISWFLVLLVAHFPNAQGESATDLEMLLIMEKIAQVKMLVHGDYRKVHQAFWAELNIDIEPEIKDILQGPWSPRARRDDSDSTLIEVEVRGTITQELIDLINENGQVTFSSTRFGSLLALIQPSYIKALATHSGVTSILPPGQFVTKKTVISEGVQAHRVDIAAQRFPSYQGNGVKVGVLSDSVDYLATVQAAGDLPSVTVLAGQAGSGTGEGTAILEIVNDMAPQAELYFATASTSQDSFAENILSLAQQGCQVIVDDVIYFSEPVFEDGSVAQAVDSVGQQGVLYFSSAGNDGSKLLNSAQTYEKDYNPTPWLSYTDPNFTPIYLDAHGFAPNITNNLIFGEPEYLTLHWSDLFSNPVADYDLFAFDEDGNLLGASIGYLSAFEFITLPGNISANAIIARYDGPIRFISLRSFEGEKMTYSTNGNIYGHAAAENAIAVGAIDHSDRIAFVDLDPTTLLPEIFSSDGPRKIFYINSTEVTPGNLLATGGIIRLKPEVLGADGVESATPGFNPFYGTSAAAPHVASIAAIALSARPKLTQAEFRLIITQTAIDILTPGVDDVSGYGIIDAVFVLQYIEFCLPNPCGQNGRCILSGNSSTCLCPNGESGPTCGSSAVINPCASNPCLNGGTCVHSGNSSTCHCPTGFSGTTCETSTNVCLSNPCLNGASCIQSGNVPVCNCTTGFAGQTCQYKIPLPCNPNPCLNGAFCDVVGLNVTCDCAMTGYKGTLCETRAYCGQTVDENAFWGTSLSLTSKVKGICIPGYSGSPTRKCGFNGKFGPVSDGCVPLSCPNDQFANASWSGTFAGELSAGVCNAGFVGTPFRQCLITGVWADFVSFPCQIGECRTLTVNNVIFPATKAGRTVTGKCVTGSGSPKAYCGLQADWEYVIGTCS